MLQLYHKRLIYQLLILLDLGGIVFKYTLEDLKEIIKRLRAENGCAWDRIQTHETLREAMLEEAYEVVEAINHNDTENLKEELGDVLLQVVFHAQIEEEQKNFDLSDVITAISEKMIHRHPHVFGTEKADTPEKVLQNWEQIKKKEKKYQTQTEAMKKIPDALPALTKAKKVQKKAKEVGFDFENIQQAMEKVKEELQELEETFSQSQKRQEEELGDLLFSIVNISRFLQLNPEFALTKAVKKFINRFECVEQNALMDKKSLSDMTLEELELFWLQAKHSKSPTEE